MTSTITHIDRDTAIARANEAECTDEIAELRKLIVDLTAEIEEKQQELWDLQYSLAGTIQA